jgi:acyl-CoA thioesterase-1
MPTTPGRFRCPSEPETRGSTVTVASTPVSLGGAGIGEARVARDLRVCFVGDSFVAGVGDGEHLGWVGRLAARAYRAGHPLTAYNLGVRRQTSAQVLRRFAAECELRLPRGSDSRVVCSFGVNDTTLEGGRTRVPVSGSLANLSALIESAAEHGWSLLMVGPPPIGDPEQDDRTEALHRAIAGVCERSRVGYVGVFEALRGSTVWMSQVRAGDGAHPGSEGYQCLTELVWPGWLSWLSGA